MPARSIAPNFIKRFIWNRKPINLSLRPDLCPVDFVDFMARELSKTESLLDFGCATGHLLIALRERGWEGHYTGVDISSKAIEIGKSIKDQNSQFHCCAFEDFPVRKVDAISFLESLYYARDVDMLLKRWSHGRIYARIVHQERHQDIICKLRGERFGAIYKLHQ